MLLRVRKPGAVAGSGSSNWKMTQNTQEKSYNGQKQSLDLCKQVIVRVTSLLSRQVFIVCFLLHSDKSRLFVYLLLRL